MVVVAVKVAVLVSGNRGIRRRSSSSSSSSSSSRTIRFMLVDFKNGPESYCSYLTSPMA